MATIPRAKKPRRDAPVVRVTAQSSSRMTYIPMVECFFAVFCKHSIDYVRVDTIKDHLKNKKHLARKEARSSEAREVTTSRQVTLGTVVGSKELREDFILDYVKLCTLADIPP